MIENSEPPRKKSKKKKKNKSNEKPSAFEEQLAKDPQLEISEADEGRRFTLSLALPGIITVCSIKYLWEIEFYESLLAFRIDIGERAVC